MTSDGLKLHLKRDSLMGLIIMEIITSSFGVLDALRLAATMKTRIAPQELNLQEAMMASPKWQEVKASKEKRQSEYLRRMERKEEKEKKQKLGAAAALAFSRK